MNTRFAMAALEQHRSPMPQPCLASRTHARRAPPMVHRPFICVYMMTNRKHGTLYIGVTADLIVRVTHHRAGDIPGFTATYALNRLVWFEGMM